MPAITEQQKIMMGVLVVVALLFAGSAVNGGGNDDQAAAHPGGFIEWLGDRFGGPPDAARAELSAPCMQQDKLVVKDGTCTLKVARSGAGQRNVRLRSDSDLAVQAKAPGHEEFVRSDVKADATVSVTVDGDGGDIDLICAGDRTCTLTLVGGK